MATASTKPTTFKTRFTEYLERVSCEKSVFEMGMQKPGTGFPKEYAADTYLPIESEQQLITARRVLENRFHRQGLTAIEHLIYTVVLLPEPVDDFREPNSFFTLRATENTQYMTMKFRQPKTHTRQRIEYKTYTDPSGSKQNGYLRYKEFSDSETNSYLKIDHESFANHLVWDFCYCRSLSQVQRVATRILLTNPFFRIHEPSDFQKYTFLHLAAYTKNVQAVEILRTHPETTGKIYSKDGFTPLQLAIESDIEGKTEDATEKQFLLNEKIIRAVKGLGAINWRAHPDNQSFGGLTALQMAVRKTKLAAVRVLLNDPDCRVNIPSKEGETLAILAAKTDNPEIFAEVLKNSRVQIDPQKKEEQDSLLIYLINYHPELVGTLLELRPDLKVNTQNDYRFCGNHSKMTALQLAMTRQRVSITPLLKHPRINVMTLFSGDLSPFRFYAEAEKVKILKSVTEHRTFNIRGKNEEGDTPIHFAVETEDVDLLKFLYELNGAKEAAQIPNKGKTAIQLAQMSGCRKICDVLGAKPEEVEEEDSSSDEEDFSSLFSDKRK